MQDKIVEMNNSTKAKAKAARQAFLISALVLTTEERENYTHLRESYLDYHRPCDPVQLDLVDEMVSAKWRQQRLWGFETATIELRIDSQTSPNVPLNINHLHRAACAFRSEATDSKALPFLQTYERTLQEIYQRALRLLRELQSPLNPSSPSVEQGFPRWEQAA